MTNRHHLLLLFQSFQGCLHPVLLLLLLLLLYLCFQALEGAQEALLRDVTLQNSDALLLC